MGSTSENGPRHENGPTHENVPKHEIDLGPWVDPPPDDQSPHADFRREVADLAREVLASFASGARKRPDQPDGADQPAGADQSTADPKHQPDRQPTSRPTNHADREAMPLSRAHFDLRAAAPYQLVRTYRALARGVTSGRSGAGGANARTVLVRDLVLMEVARSRPATPTALRRRLGIPASTLSAVIESCVRRGWLRRRRHAGDRRRCLIDPTPAGLERADETARAWRAADEAIAGALSPIERDQLRWLLKRAGSALARAGH